MGNCGANTSYNPPPPSDDDFSFAVFNENLNTDYFSEEETIKIRYPASKSILDLFSKIKQQTHRRRTR